MQQLPLLIGMTAQIASSVVCLVLTLRELRARREREGKRAAALEKMYDETLREQRAAQRAFYDAALAATRRATPNEDAGVRQERPN